MELTTSNGRITMGGANGEIVLFISDEDTLLLTARTAVYDLLVTSPGGEATRIVEGQVTIDPAVTIP